MECVGVECSTSTVLYAMGTIVALAGTGFVIGVSWPASVISMAEPSLIICSQFFRQLKLVRSISRHPTKLFDTYLQMFKPVRVVATIVFLISIVLIFVAAFVLRND